MVEIFVRTSFAISHSPSLNSSEGLTICWFYFWMINKACVAKTQRPKRSETVDLWDAAAFHRQEERDCCHMTCGQLLFTAQDNDVIVARAKWPATGDEQTDGKQSHRLGE